jgi:hypothetical protein
MRWGCSADHHVVVTSTRSAGPRPACDRDPWLDLPAHLLLEALDDRPLHPAIAAGGPGEHDQREFIGMRAQILAAPGPSARQRIAGLADQRIGGLALSSGWSAWQLGDAGKGAGLAPRKILQAPEIGDRIDGEHGRGIVALLLDQLADLRRRPFASSAIGGSRLTRASGSGSPALLWAVPDTTNSRAPRDPWRPPIARPPILPGEGRACGRSEPLQQLPIG